MDIMNGIAIFVDHTLSPELCTEADFGGQIVPDVRKIPGRSRLSETFLMDTMKLEGDWWKAGRMEAERREAERREAERREADRREAERRDAERRVAERWAILGRCSGYASSRRWLTLQLLGVREVRTRRGKSCCYLRKARLSKRRNRSGDADHMQIFSDCGAILQTVCRSSAETEESTQILKIPCNGYNELSFKELICEPRSPGNSRGCNTGQKKEDDLMTRFAPVLKQSLHDALEPILGPVACELQSQEEEARKERQRLLALEKQKLALNLQELVRLKRRRAGRSQRRHLTIR